MAIAKPWLQQRFYSNDDSSPAVGDVSRLSQKDNPFATDQSATIGQRQAKLFEQIVEARARSEHAGWDDEGAPAIPQEVSQMAISLLCALPDALPPPSITPEPTGEFAFEWYKDRNHVAVITVDGGFIRWSAMVGADSPVTGAEPFTKSIPRTAIDTVLSALR